MSKRSNELKFKHDKAERDTAKQYAFAYLKERLARYDDPARVAMAALMIETGVIITFPDKRQIRRSKFINYGEDMILRPVLNFLDGSDPSTHVQFTGEFTERLVQRAQEADDVVADRAITALVQQFIKQGDSIPRDLSDYLARKSVRQIRGGKRKSNWTKNDLRDYYIAETVYTLHEMGLTVARSKSSAPNSACDYVADAANRLKFSISMDGVRKIWDEHKFMFCADGDDNSSA